MREQDQTAAPTEPAGVPAEGADLAAALPGPVARQLLQVAEAQGLKLAEGQDLMALLAGLKAESPIPLEAMATVSGILLLLFQAEARFTAERDGQSGVGR